MANSKKQKELLEIKDVVERLNDHSDQKLIEIKAGIFGKPPSEIFKKAINQILKSRGHNIGPD